MPDGFAEPGQRPAHPIDVRQGLEYRTCHDRRLRAPHPHGGTASINPPRVPRSGVGEASRRSLESPRAVRAPSPRATERFMRRTRLDLVVAPSATERAVRRVPCRAGGVSPVWTPRACSLLLVIRCRETAFSVHAGRDDRDDAGRGDEQQCTAGRPSWVRQLDFAVENGGGPRIAMPRGLSIADAWRRGRSTASDASEVAGSLAPR